MESMAECDEARCVESIGDIVSRVDEGCLRSFVAAVARGNVVFERELREEFELADADALMDRAMSRLGQLQRIYEQDEGSYYTEALLDVRKHMEQAVALADDDGRGRLFERLVDFLEEGYESEPEEYVWSIREREQALVEAFVWRHFAPDPQFAQDYLEFADDRISELAFRAAGGCYRAERECTEWMLSRLVAMAARGDEPYDLHVYAKEHELLGYEETVRMLADLCVAADLPRAAADLLRENLDTVRLHAAFPPAEPPRLVELLEQLAEACYDEDELADLYWDLLTRDWGEPYWLAIYSSDLGRWYDKLHHLVDEGVWADMREELLGTLSHDTAETLLVHESLSARE